MDRFPFSLSLYAIVSRECASKYIARSLESMLPLQPDEIVLCSAMGKNTDDGLPILEEVAKKFNAKVVVYRNKAGSEHLDHLDSFADARNTALEACTKDWCMWFDADDLLAKGAERGFFEIAKRVTDHECIYAGYSVPSAGLCPIRERITKRGEFRWSGPVHEQLKPFKKESAKAIGTPAGLIVHAPMGYKKSSADRNHNILDASLARSAIHTYYKADEYFLAGKYVEAIRWAKTAISFEDLDMIMRVQCHTIIGRCLADPVAKREELFKAYALQPDRSEALFYIADDYYSRRNYREALALARSASMIPKPNVAYWTTKDSIYNWEAPDLYERCARVLKMDDIVAGIQADKKKNFGDVDITLCHATARPDKFNQARWLWLSNANKPNNIQHIIGVDEDHPDYAGNEKIVTPNGKCIGAWNACATQAKGKYIVQLSDDFSPVMGWDDEIRKRLPNPEVPAVLAVSDGHRKDDLLCMAICTKKTLDYLGGHLFHPEYAQCSGIFSDNEFTLRTKDIQVDGRDLVFEHRNPFWTGENQDEVFKKHNSVDNYQLGERIFKARNP